MYHKMLRISIFSLDPALARTVQDVMPRENFSHEIKILSDLSSEALKACNLAIIDLPEIAHPASMLPETENPNTRIVFVANSAQTQAFSNKDYQAIDNLWIKPLNDTRIIFELENVLNREKTKADLHLYQQYLDTTIDSIPELVWFKDLQGIHSKVNDAFCSAVEKTKEQVNGKGHNYIWDISEEEYASGKYICSESEGITMEARKTCLFEEPVKTKNGMRQFNTYKSPLFDEDGSVMGTVGIAHDVTDLGNIKTELGILINSMPYAIIVLDTQGIVIDLNQKTEEYFAVQRAKVIGCTFNELRHLALGRELADSRNRYETDVFSGIIGGVEKTIELHKTYINDVFSNKTGQLRIYRDITKETELEACIIKNANTDYLTGLCNRRYLYEHIRDYSERTLTLLSIDLDDFKYVNDTYGHQAGDLALMEASHLLNEAFPDDMVVRMGGDEFVVVIVDERPPASVHMQALAYLATLKARAADAGDTYAITASIGIATASEPGMDIDALIRQSDAALYQAKRAGKSQCCSYSPSMGELDNTQG